MIFILVIGVTFFSLIMGNVGSLMKEYDSMTSGRDYA